MSQRLKIHGVCKWFSRLVYSYTTMNRKALNGKMVEATNPGAQRLKLGKHLVHRQIAPLKISKQEIKYAISKVHVRPNSKIDQALLISAMTKSGS